MNTIKRIATVACGCDTGPSAEYQDRRYGKGRRVFTVDAKGNGKCTVCSRIHNGITRDIPAKKKGNGGSGGAKTMTVYPPIGGWLGGRPEENGFKRIGGK